MKKYFYSFLFSFLFFLFLFFYPSRQATTESFSSNVVSVYTWVDFIPLALQEKFQKETGYKLNVDYMDTDEMLEAKLLTGKSEYDVIYPSTPYLFRHINLGLYAPLDLSLLPNYKNVDKIFVEHLSFPSSKVFVIPYLWGSSGVCYNVDVFSQEFPNKEVNSWKYVFSPEKLKRVAKYGVASNVSPNELFSSIGFFRGFSPCQQPPTDAFVQESYLLAKKARPFWRVFLSSDAAVHALGSGEVVMAFMWNGDAVEAINVASTKGRKLKYIVPKEGGLLWIDGLAIPKAAKNKKGAHALINFLLKAENMAAVTNAVRFANTSSAAKPYVNAQILNNNVLYPRRKERERLYLDKRTNPKLERSINRHFFKILVGY